MGVSKNVLKIWAGQVFSQIGTRIYQIGLSWWILSEIQEQAGLKMGLLLAIGALPAIVAVKWIGRKLDTSNLKALLVQSDLAAAFASLGILLFVEFYGPNLSVFYVGAFVLAFFQGIIDPGLNRAIPEVTEKSEVESAVALIANTATLASFLGAILGAIIVSQLGLTGTLAINALSYFLSALFAQRTRFHSAVSIEGGKGVGKLNFSDLSHSMKRLLIGFGLLNFFATPTLVVLPAYVKNVFAGDANLFSLLEAMLWLGMCAGAALGPKWGGQNYISNGILGLTGMGVAFIINSLNLPHFAFGVSLFAAGFFLGFANVKFLTLFQNVVPNAVKGQFFAWLTALCSFTFPIAFFLFGFLIDHISPREIFLIQGFGVLLICSMNLPLRSKEEEVWA